MRLIKSVVDEFIKKNHLEDEYIFAKISEIWESELPKHISENVKTVKFCSGILELYTTSSAWRKEILLRKTEITGIINSHLQTQITIEIEI